MTSAALRTLADLSPGFARRSEQDQFARIRLPDGIFKTTGAGRLADVDAATCAMLGPPRVLEAIDIGASSGSTTLDLLSALRAIGHRPRIVLADVSIRARLLPLSRRHQVLVSPAGALLQHVIGGVSIRPWQRRLDFCTQYWIVSAIANARFRRSVAAGALRSGEGGQDIWMVLPDIASEPAIGCAEADVFLPPTADETGRFDLVRAANLLIPGVFPEHRIARALDGLRKRLKGPGSLLVLARSPAPGAPGCNRATIYRLDTSGRLDAVSRLGGGVDIEALVPIGPPGA